MILNYLVNTNDIAISSMINAEWFHNTEYKICIDVIQSLHGDMSYAKFNTSVEDKYPSRVSAFTKRDIFRKDSVEIGEVNASIDIIEEKYQLRQIEGKLVNIHSTMFEKSVADIETDLITYFHKYHSNKTEIKSLSEDFEDDNTDLIEFGPSRPALNKLGVMKSTVMTIGGDSSHQKTNQLIDILVNALVHNYPINPDFTVMMFSGEMSWKRIRDRIYAKMLGIEHEKIKSRKNMGMSSREVNDLFNMKFPYFKDHFHLIDPKQFRTVADLSRLVIQYKPDIWGLDFLQYFAQMSAGNNAEQQNKNVMEAIATIKILSEVTNSLAIILSQLRKKSEQRQTHFPRIDDLEWSGLTKQISDIVGMCFWPYKIQQTVDDMRWFTVSWQKVRDAEPFNEVLQSWPEICDFKKHPNPQVGSKYFGW